ncbi:MAG TPA: hypothetical protein VNH19_11960 [Candidatus Limnocylindrales bacterium]|nr:hypothetical protein [Candidatus Limnocylindrales bacterium]
MSGNEPLMIEDASGNATPEIFALTDEQILGLEAEGQGVEPNPSSRVLANARQGPSTAAANAAASARDDRGSSDSVSLGDGKSAQARVPVPQEIAQEPPGWLTREMEDPWVGDEARQLWEGVQRAQREAEAYREAFATPEDARALKEIYPGGVAEAKSAAARARELAEIDAVFFGAAGKPVEELRAGRAALVEKLYAQDPAAFREMVEAALGILGGDGARSNEAGSVSQDATTLPRSLHSVAGAPKNGAQEKAGHSGRDDRSSTIADENPRHVQLYREFERATNAELEKSVGGAIGRAMEAALPNLRHANTSGGEGPLDSRGKQTSSLQERLATAVREEVETALRSDASLGEQVARVLSGRRFDEAARTQVVRLIDARAQQLVPGAVRRVVGSWTQATLGTRKLDAGAENAGRGADERKVERAPSSSQRTSGGNSGGDRNAQTAAARGVPRGRVDYRKLSDEQILGM